MSWRAEEHDPEWPFDLIGTRFRLDLDATALLVVDMQGSDGTIDPDSRIGVEYPEIAAYWNGRIADLVVPNIRRLLESFRQRGRRVVYTRNGAITPHGDELTARLRSHVRRRTPVARYRGTAAYDVMPALAPRQDELVVDKLTSGAFNASILDHALRNMGVRDVVIVGISTDMCVHGTARVAAELGYNSLICEDACATYTARAHQEALLMHARVFGRVATTDDVLAELNPS